MKLIAFFLFTLFSLSALAEHDAIYCGKIYRGANARVDSFRPMLVLDLDKRARYNGDWADDFEYGNAYAAVVAAGDTDTAKIEQAMKKGNPQTRYCVKGRWAGSAYDSWNVSEIVLTTDNVNRFGLASSFNIKE